MFQPTISALVLKLGVPSSCPHLNYHVDAVTEPSMTSSICQSRNMSHINGHELEPHSLRVQLDGLNEVVVHHNSIIRGIHVKRLQRSILKDSI